MLMMGFDYSVAFLDFFFFTIVAYPNLNDGYGFPFTFLFVF